MEVWIPVVLGLLGLVGTYLAYRRYMIEKEIEREERASAGWREQAKILRADLQSMRAEQRQAVERAMAGERRIWELEQTVAQTTNHFTALEQDHLALAAQREADREQLDALRLNVKRLEARVAYYRRIVRDLINQLTDHGLEPVVRPDDDHHE